MPERTGTATDTLHGFEEIFESLFKGSQKYEEKASSYPMFKYLAQFSNQGKEKTGPSATEEEQKDGQKLFRNYETMSDKDRNELKVDEIFALYLNNIAKKVNENFYKTVLTFTIMFRECLNEIGWQKKFENEQEKAD